MNETAAHIFPAFANSSEKLSVQQITLELSPDEVIKLEKYCELIGKAATDVIRELIQDLPIT
ncbi:MAG: CopG family transcriptional regulator [Mastigocladus sp. ERB_26_2]